MKKTLVITGASKGIGLATAKLFAEEGYQVLNLSRSQPPEAGISHLPFDLAREDWGESEVQAVRDHVAGSDEIVLIHNAALLEKDSTADVGAESLRHVLELNVVAATRLNQLLLPLMGSGSSILYVGSTLGEKAVANSCSYVVSKHAQIGLMRSTCQDMAGSGIHAACVCPGFTDTEMLRAHVGNDEGIIGSLASGVTFGRLIEPGEIARSLLFCAQNPVINGSVIHANLGQVES